MNQISDTDARLRTAQAIELFGEGPADDELSDDFAARVIDTVGARAYSLVLARIQNGSYPQPDTAEWDQWQRIAVSALRRGEVR